MKKSRKRSGRKSRHVAKRTRHMRTKRNPRRSRGTKKHKKRYVQRGGWNLGNIIAKFPFGQDLVNVGRGAGHGINNIYRGVKGVHKGVGPYPTQNQLTRRAGAKSGSGSGSGKPMDMASIYKKNKQVVKGI